MAASSPVEICNRAIEAIGIDPVTSLDDSSKTARVCKRVYPQLRDSMLRSFPWPFAIARAALPALAPPAMLPPTPLSRYQNAFQLPSDCVRLLSLYLGCCWVSCGACATGASWFQRGGEEGDWPAYAVEGQTVMTNASAPLAVRYVSRVTDTAAFDPIFTDALVASIAANICMPLRNNAQLLGILREDLQARMQMARSVANLEAGHQAIDRAPVLMVRH